MTDRLILFDTTLRDGEQAPGIALTPDEKVAIAHQLAKLAVDVLEAGFAASSPGDFEAVSRIAKTDSTVYIHGESGTGKELIAKAIHLQSNRKDGPFVAINCAAIPENLLESELFGHEKGAFTGAVRSTKGLFTQANGGTLFLDEIGDMPLSVQVKLLRALEERQFYPVGNEKPVQVDVRIVVATKKDLVEEVRQDRFREDLFYRIHVIPIILPPLKERAEDIPYLVEHLLKKISRQMKKEISGVTPKAMQKLMQHDWPGNVRELENTLEFAVTMTQQNVVTDDLVLQVKAPTNLASNGGVVRRGPIATAYSCPSTGVQFLHPQKRPGCSPPRLGVKFPAPRGCCPPHPNPPEIPSWIPPVRGRGASAAPARVSLLPSSCIAVSQACTSRR